MTEPDLSGYQFRDEPMPAHRYILPAVRSILDAHFGGRRARVFEIGCGKGDMAAALADRYAVTGVDPSTQGIALAKAKYPRLDLHSGSAYDDLPALYGSFPAVMSIDVIEYTTFPRTFAANLFNLLEPEGIAIVSAPYHGYWKNLALALTNSLDRHFNSTQDYGRVKFWSVDTLGLIMREAGFVDLRFLRLGRLPPIAMAMVCVARKPRGAP